MQETQVRSLGQKDALGKEMATHSSILAWEMSWTEEPGVLHSGKCHGQRILVCYTPRGHKELDMT